MTLLLVVLPVGTALSLCACACVVRRLRPGLFLAGPLARLGDGLSPKDEKAVTRGEREEREEKRRKEEQKKKKKIDDQAMQCPSSTCFSKRPAHIYYII